MTGLYKKILTGSFLCSTNGHLDLSIWEYGVNSEEMKNPIKFWCDGLSIRDLPLGREQLAFHKSH